MKHSEEANALRHEAPVCERFKAWLYPKVPVIPCPDCGGALRETETPGRFECKTCLLDGRTITVTREVV